MFTCNKNSKKTLMCTSNRYHYTTLLNESCCVFFTAELGDFNPEEHKDGYLNGFLFIPNQSLDFEKLVAEKHKQHR